MTGPAVEILGVQKRFGDHVALHDIDLTVAPNEFLSLLGPSGCGKTTLLRIIAGFETPTAGRVLVRGEDMSGIPPHRRPTNLVFQRGALFPHMNVAQNIGYSLKVRGWPKKRIADRVEELLALVRLEGLGERGPTELSGGQIQRAALARALAPEPSVLLLDEPLSALDLKLRQHMQLELRAIQRQLKATFVYVTHDQTEALVMSDRIAIMNEGHIVQLGSPREIYTRPATIFASDFIGETNLFEGTVVDVAEGEATMAMASGTTLRARAASPLVVGDPATVSVRPESIRVTSTESPAAGHLDGSALEGRVREIVYLGSRVRIEIATPAGTVAWADLRDEETEGLALGDLVRLSWSPRAASVWAGSALAEGGDPNAPHGISDDGGRT